MRLLTLIPLVIGSIIHTTTSTPTAPSSPSLSSVIKTTKITPSYWRATFSDPPFNIQGNAFFRDFYALVDQITSDPDVKVVVFDSSSQFFFSTHVDLINPLDPNLWPGNPRYWDSITRLSKAPVLTVAAIRGRTYNAGAEIADVLDIRFGSKEKAVFAQFETGFGEYYPSDLICSFTDVSSPGANPGGGGIEMLSRLTGRSRALEIVLGADTFDADTAALYGCMLPSSSWTHVFIFKTNAKLEKKGLIAQSQMCSLKSLLTILPAGLLVGITPPSPQLRISSMSAPGFLRQTSSWKVSTHF